MALKYKLDDDSIAAIMWRAERWGEKPATLDADRNVVRNKDCRGHGTGSRAAFDRSIVLEWAHDLLASTSEVLGSVARMNAKIGSGSDTIAVLEAVAAGGPVDDELVRRARAALATINAPEVK